MTPSTCPRAAGVIGRRSRRRLGLDATRRRVGHALAAFELGGLSARPAAAGRLPRASKGEQAFPNSPLEKADNLLWSSTAGCLSSFGFKLNCYFPGFVLVLFQLLLLFLCLGVLSLSLRNGGIQFSRQRDSG